MGTGRAISVAALTFGTGVKAPHAGHVVIERAVYHTRRAGSRALVGLVSQQRTGAGALLRTILAAGGTVRMALYHFVGVRAEYYSACRGAVAGRGFNIHGRAKTARGTVGSAYAAVVADSIARNKLLVCVESRFCRHGC